MAYPFLFFALSLAGGILFASLFNLPSAAGAAAGILFLAAGWLLFVLRKIAISFLSLLLAVFFLGSFTLSRFVSAYERHPLTRLDLEGYADITGVLFRSPARELDRDLLFLRVERLVHGRREFKFRGNISVFVPRSEESEKPLRLLAGDRVRVAAQLRTAEGFRNFAPPFLPVHLKTRNIHRTASTKSRLLVEKEEGRPRYPFRRWMSGIRARMTDLLESSFPSEDVSRISATGAILEALLLGERGRLREATADSLRDSGLFHLFAISGAHIAIISLLAFSLLRLLRIPRRPSSMILILLLTFYAFLVEGRPSVLRATVMALAFLLGKLFWKDVHLLNTISLSAFFLLAAGPMNLFEAGFQLTFAATFAIILIFPRLFPLLPRLPLKLGELFVLSVSAQVGVLPIMASVFNRLTIAPLLLNIVAVPLVGLIMASGHIFLLVVLIAPASAGLLAPLLEIPVASLLFLSRIPAGVPMLSSRLPAPHPLLLAAYALFLLLLFIPGPRRPWKATFLVLFFATMTVIAVHPFPPRSAPGLRLTFLDVGQGDSILVEFPGRKKMLVDGGGIPSGRFDIGENVVSPFLWQKRMKSVDYLVLTHAHPDHILGLQSVAENFKVREFWEIKDPPDNGLLARLKTSLPRKTELKQLAAGTTMEISGVRVDVLHPAAGRRLKAVVDNEDSLVLRLSDGHSSFLLTADIGRRSETRILEGREDIRSEVLKSPHHGSDSSSSEEFLRAVLPRVAVITVGKNNPFGLPNPTVIERYEALGALVFRTDRDGAVEITSVKDALSIRTAAGRSLLLRPSPDSPAR